MDWAIVYDMLSGKGNSSFGWDEHSFLYYDQLTTIYTKYRATRKDAQIFADIVEEIDAEDVANIPKERNNYHGCKANVSLD
ncbi:hypothetical protein CXB51_019291 [Gossypium anomalum]|uniref:Myb/SANT-like domain-containing protein n=1 Tax=Gossypium anomalum TaxID=47600 RepID=A0A8J5YI28_9ROSI|nr:hypothetical protein CXB51_019291 [Gossypium anomalum]